MSALKGSGKVNSKLNLRRAAQVLVGIGLAFVVGCHMPLSGRAPGAMMAARAILPDASDRLSGSEGVILGVGKPEPLSEAEREADKAAQAAATAQTLPTVTMASGLVEQQAPLPAVLQGKSYGKMGIAIKWPELSQSRYQTQFIPQSAQSIRVRVVGSNGKNRLSVMFFREDSPASTLTQATAFFMPVEAGLLVEVRAFGEKKGQLQVIDQAVVTPSPYNPEKFPEYNMMYKRVLAEGFQFNVQVSLLSKTPVKVELDSSQLVAGIGGTPAMNSGGDPYFNNYYSTSRFAELADPTRVFYDKGQTRLFWVEFPSWKLQEEPMERDMVRMLNSSGLAGTADGSPSVLVMSQVAGGDRLRTDEAGDGNKPDCAILNGISDIAWAANGPGGSPALFVAESSSSVSPSRIRRLAPADATGIVRTDSRFPANNPVVRDYSAVTGAVSSADDVLVIDSTYQVVRGDGDFSLLLGGGTESISATESRDVDKVGLTNPLRLAAFTSGDFLLINGNTVARVIGSKVQVKVGGGETEPSLTAEAPDASALNLSQLKDIKYDPLKDGGNPVAYLADGLNSVVWKLKLGSGLNSQVKAKAIKVKSPRFLAVAPAGGVVYSMDGEGGITKITIGAVDATESVNVGAFPGARGFAVGAGSGTDQLFIAFATTITSVAANAGVLGTRIALFGQVDKNDLVMGDCADIAGTLSDGGAPRLAPVIGKGTANLTKPSWLSSDTAGNVYIADTGNHRIRKVSLNGQGAPTRIISLVRSRPLDPTPTLTLDSPQGVDVDEFGNAFIADTNNNQIVVWRPCNGQLAEGKVDPNTVFAQGGLLPVAGTGQAGINFDNINATLVQLRGPKAVRVEKNAESNPSRRRIFFIDQGSRLRMLTPYYTAITRPSNNSLSAAQAPICPSPAGGDADNYFKYIISTVAGAGTGGDGPNAAQASLGSPVDLALDKDGYVYVADGNRIRRIDPITGSISTIYTAPQGLGSISIDEVNKELYFTMTGLPSIRKVFLGN